MAHETTIFHPSGQRFYMGLPSVEFFNPPDTYETPALADCEKCGERVLYCLETRERQERLFGRLPLVCQSCGHKAVEGTPMIFVL
ncbi:hypothetical protein Pla144_36310 [Bythopirellula polymerisocia]|uniref:Uncharacterized protein n=1 Tax=Bythopirellula polymerisocia TaxID=2528003 RepID=A0A5C6CL06_9BACT|nr:hypothetical protein Pla144_36310 [Bythopirellula polymerisocia]